MFQIITDSAVDITKEDALKHNVEVIPFYVSTDGQNFVKESEGFSKDEFFDKLINDKDVKPKSSQPNPQDYIEFYTSHLKEGRDILSLAITSKLSGSYASAQIAAETLAEEYPDRKIMIVDTLNLTVGQILLLDQVKKMRDAGFSLQETYEKAEKIKGTIHVYFVLETLEFLHRGGRIGGAAAFVGSILKLKPILQMYEGAVEKFESVRGTKNAIKRLYDLAVNAISEAKDDMEFCVGHIRNRDVAEEYKSGIEKAIGKSSAVDIVDIGTLIGVHAGPGAIAVSYCKKYDKV